MKKTRKVLSLLLTLCMVTSMCPPALAEELSNELDEQIKYIEDIQQKQQEQIDETITEEEQEAISNEETINEEIADEEQNITSSEEIDKEEDSNDKQDISSNEDTNNEIYINVEQEVIPNEDDEDVKLEENENQETTPNEEEKNTESNKEDLEEISKEENDNEEFIEEEEEEITTANDDVTSGTCGDNLTWTLENGTLTVSGTGNMSASPWEKNNIKTVIIQDGVTSISDSAFSNCSELINVSIPDSVSSIGSSAFAWCSNLTLIRIPDGVTSIKEATFFNCFCLTSVKLPDSITSIDTYAFNSCSNLTSIKIPDSVTSIGERSFSGCTNLTSITIPDSVVSMGSYVFNNCKKLTDVYYGGSEDQWKNLIKDAWGNDELISANIHYNKTDQDNSNENSGTCGGNLTWTLENGTLTISGTGDMYIFFYKETPWYTDRKKITTIKIQNGVTNISLNAFRDCSNLTSIKIPNSVTEIHSDAFCGCSNLTSIEIPDGVTNIEGNTFDGCSSLTSIKIPNNVTNIELNAFVGCSSLTDIYYSGNEDQWKNLMNNTDVGNDPLLKATVHYNSTGPDDPDPDNPTLTKGFVSILKEWNVDTGEIQFDNIIVSMTKYFVTVDTELPSEGLNNLIGKYIWVETEPGATEFETKVTHIQALDSKLGTLTAASKSNVTIDGTTYPFIGNNPPFFISEPYDILYHKIGDTVISVQSLSKKTGTLEEWDGTKNQVTIGREMFHTNYVTDMSFLGNLSQIIGSKVDYLFLDNVVFRITSVGDKEIASGICGDNLTWTIKDGTLIISGTGDMYDYELDLSTATFNMPWEKNKNEITKVVVENGVTSIGNTAFSTLAKTESISVGTGVKTIGDRAFPTSDGSLTKIHFYGDAPKFTGMETFPKFINIYYDASKNGWSETINQFGEFAAFIFSKDATNKLAVKDMWSFGNSYEYFGNEENGYYISQSDYNQLVSNLSLVEKLCVISGNGIVNGKLIVKGSFYNINGNTKHHNKWGGSCYGMSTLIALVSSGTITLSELGSSEDTLSKITLHPSENSSMESIINFYQGQQFIPFIEDIEVTFMKQDQTDQIKKMEEIIHSVEENKHFALITFGYRHTDEHIKNHQHAILGYAIEDGIFHFTINGKDYQFDHRVLTYDPNNLGNKQDHYNNSIYYNDTIWALPGYDIVSKTNNINIVFDDNTAQLRLVIADIDYLNAVDYRTGEKNFNSVQENAYLYTNSKKRFAVSTPNGVDPVQNGLFNGENTISDNGGVILVAAANSDSNEDQSYSIAYPNLDSDYEIVSEDEPISFSMGYENYYLSANSDQPGNVQFSPDGKVELTTKEGSSSSLSITANNGYHSLPWHTISVENPDTKEISLELNKDGVLLEGDDLTDITIYGTDEEETQELKFSTQENKVLVSEEKEELVILEDSNKDGIFDKVVYPTEKPKPEEPKPEEPDEPNKPDEPSTPNKPVTPSTPSNPNVPPTPDKPAKPENPDTSKEQFTITFSGNGGRIDDETLKTILTSKDGKITNLPIPTRTDYTFDGWFSDRYDGEEITTDTVFTQYTKVYAHWTRNENSGNGSSGSGSGSGGGGSSYKHSSSSSSSKSTTSNQKAKVSCTAGGTIIANNDGTATITPDEGYKIFAISVNGRSVTIPSDGKLTNLKSEDNVMVRFDPISEIIATSTPSNNSNKFIDVLPDAWYYEAVNYVVEHNLFSGMSETKFAPNDTMTRAMLMTVLARMDGQDVTSGTTWYEKGINWAKQKQISDGTNPQFDVTREQLAAMLYRYAGYPTTTGNLSEFTDANQVNTYAKSALCWATEKGIISGKGNNVLDPKGKATRAEVAAILMRFCEMR